MGNNFTTKKNFTTGKTIIHPISKDYFNKVKSLGGDVIDKNSINNFVSQLSRIIDPSLWVCWPLRSLQSIGSGTIAPSLGGLGDFPGTLTNGPTWGTDGIIFGGVTSFGSRIEISSPAALSSIVANGASIFGACSNVGEDNLFIFLFDLSTNSLRYPSLSVNQTNSTGVVPQAFRSGSVYFQSNRGGAFSAGFSTVGGVIRPTSQANYRNGNLISNETGLSPLSQSGAATSLRFGRGNGTPGATIPISLVSSTLLSNVQMQQINTIYKQTLGQGLGLP